MYDSVSCFVNHKDSQEPDDEQIGQGSNDLHTMIAKCHFFSGFFTRKINEEEADSKSNQIGNQMKGIRDDSNGTWNVPTDKLSSDENERDDDDNVQFTEISTVVFKRRGLVQKLFVPCHWFKL